MNKKITAIDIINDAHWHLCHLDITSYTARFVYLSREVINKTTFLDQRFFSTFPGTFIELDLRQFARYDFSQLNPYPINYIFHTAFCGSTLLTRCLNIEGSNLSLSEPEVLLQLANFKRNFPDFARSPDWLKIVGTVVNLLGRPFKKGEKILIKPTNSANNLISDLLALNKDSKALFLNSALPAFLISNIKKGSEYESFCQLLVKCFAMDSDYLSINNIKYYEQLKPLEKAALAWHMQQDVCADFFDNAAFEQGKSLAVHDFLEHPKQVFKHLNAFFSLQMNESEITSILASQSFNTHAKAQTGKYDRNIKRVEDDAIQEENKMAITSAIEWAKKYCGQQTYAYFNEHSLLNNGGR
jgi:hypothetical protein